MRFAEMNNLTAYIIIVASVGMTLWEFAVNAFGETKHERSPDQST
jgi:hypothetical protein